MTTPMNPLPSAPTTSPGTPNNSGMGAQSTLPPGLQGLNWGAFLFNWIWAIGNRTYIGLLGLFLGHIMGVILLIKGNEWAWQNRRWASIEEFKRVQSTWTKWGIIFLVASVILLILFLFLAVYWRQVNPPSY